MTSPASSPPGEGAAVAPAAALFVFAHQDDEFAISPRIAFELRAGRRVSCCYLTNGGQRGVGQRCQESLRVLGKLGVAPENIGFIGTELDLPDGGLHLHLRRAYDACVPFVERLGPIGAVFLPAWEGGHHDHDAAHLIALALAARAGVPPDATLQFSLYHGARIPFGLFRVMSPLAENGAVIHRHVSLLEGLRAFARLQHYRSQWRTFIGLGPGTALRYTLNRREALQRASAARVRERPHAGPLFYETRFHIPYEDFQAATGSFAAELLGVAPQPLLHAPA